MKALFNFILVLASAIAGIFFNTVFHSPQTWSVIFWIGVTTFQIGIFLLVRFSVFRATSAKPETEK